MFTDYAVNGELHAKELVLYVLQQLLPDSERSAVTDLPEKGIVTLYRQGSREIISALFASTSVSGKGIEVIRDVLPLYNVGFEVKRDKSPSRVYTAPEGGELKFEYTDGRVKFTLPRLQISQTIIIE